jgi:rsbT co-antagonist protein RsbR
LKTAAGNRLGVRVPLPPLYQKLHDTRAALGHLLYSQQPRGHFPWRYRRTVPLTTRRQSNSEPTYRPPSFREHGGLLLAPVLAGRPPFASLYTLRWPFTPAQPASPMTDSSTSELSSLVERHRATVLAHWINDQLAIAGRSGFISEADLRRQCTEFMAAFRTGLESGSSDTTDANWGNAREVLSEVSVFRARQGFAPSETATFVFALKRPLFDAIREDSSLNRETVANHLIMVTEILDRLGLYTTEVYQKGREEIILRQQQNMLELSTPVVSLWDGILALPMIGTLDSARTQIVMESLLQRIVETGAEIAIIDITGVPTVDTLTAQHLLKTVTAARLMGADCIISGIRPQIAQTIVHLGVDLGDVTTKATLADAFRVALVRLRDRKGPGTNS